MDKNDIRVPEKEPERVNVMDYEEKCHCTKCGKAINSSSDMWRHIQSSCVKESDTIEEQSKRCGNCGAWKYKDDCNVCKHGKGGYKKV